MRVIPVIDLQGGRVVHARRGARQTYAPVRSALCHRPDPVHVVQQLCRHAGAPCVYAADLDALAGGPVQLAVWRALYAAVPGLELWLDAGLRDGAAAAALARSLGVRLAGPLEPVAPAPAALAGSAVPTAGHGPAGPAPPSPLQPQPEPARERASQPQLQPQMQMQMQMQRDPAPLACLRPVFGSESLHDAAVLDTWPDAAVLSLDRRDGREMDPAGVWAQPARWPSALIVMTLERVGTGAGPDLRTLAAVRAAAGPGRALIGAGGVRDLADLQAAAAAGATAWLVASAFHDGRLPPGLGRGLPPVTAG